MKLYQELADYYFSIEKDNRNMDVDIHMIDTIAKKIKNPALLDLGCGTGEHLNILSGLNFRCTGIDSSAAMIETAKKKFNTIEFIHEEMTAFDFCEIFDIIISLFGSFCYLVNDSDIDKTLQNSWKALKPGGIGIFEVWNALPIREIREKELSFVSETNYNDKKITRERGFKLLDYYSDKTVVEVNYLYNISGMENIEDKHIMRAFTRDELSDIFKQNQFQIIDYFSNSSMDPYKNNSNKIIAYFKKSF